MTRAATGTNVALDPDHGGDVRLPVGVGQPACEIEDGNGATFVAVAALVVAAGRPERGRGRGDDLDMLVQGRLIALHLDDQGEVGRCCDLKSFFGSAGHRA